MLITFYFQELLWELRNSDFALRFKLNSNLVRLILQGQHDDLEAKFLEERAALEAKYQKLYDPLYTKVHMIRLAIGSKSGLLFFYFYFYFYSWYGRDVCHCFLN